MNSHVNASFGCEKGGECVCFFDKLCRRLTGAVRARLSGGHTGKPKDHPRWSSFASVLVVSALGRYHQNRKRAWSDTRAPPAEAQPGLSDSLVRLFYGSLLGADSSTAGFSAGTLSSTGALLLSLHPWAFVDSLLSHHRGLLGSRSFVGSHP